MTTVRLNSDALDALRLMLEHRTRMYTAKGRVADDEREQVRSYAVVFVNEMLRDNPGAASPSPRRPVVIRSGDDRSRLIVVGGCCTIFEACADALPLANDDGASVWFDFNGHEVIVLPGDDADAVAREWWQRAYGCTPEESWASR